MKRTVINSYTEPVVNCCKTEVCHVGLSALSASPVSKNIYDFLPLIACA